MPENVSLTRHGPIATVTLNCPQRCNALSDELLAELAAACGELRDDAATRIVILTGAPPVFSAGAAAGLKSGMSAEAMREAFGQRESQFRRLFERVTSLIESLEQPTIVAINGHAIGGGWGLTLPFDFRLAAAEAQFWLPEVDLGAPLGVGSTTRLVRLVGPARAKQIIMTCRRYTADELLAVGLVDRVVPGEALAAATQEQAELLASKPYRALVEVKARINAIARVAMPEVNAMTEGFLDRD